MPVWGWAEPGERVTGEHIAVGKRGPRPPARTANGWFASTSWRSLSTRIEMTIEGKNTIKIADVLVGEVWLGSGQSNMEFTVSGDLKRYPGIAKRFAGVVNEAQEIAAANYPTIREFRVPLKTSDVPLDDVAGKWFVCSPETVPGFSAIGYFFSRDLQAAIHRPVGFITSAYRRQCRACRPG